MPKTYRIAAIPGDGIGREVVPEGLRCLRAAAGAHGFALDVTEFDFASADYWLEHGTMLPEDWRDVLGAFDALFFGAVGRPEVVPDHVSLWGSLLPRCPDPRGRHLRPGRGRRTRPPSGHRADRPPRRPPAGPLEPGGMSRAEHPAGRCDGPGRGTAPGRRGGEPAPV
ncbi:isocitrate/isopropylmalate family dehydrogenase [Streptomyces sp. NB004]